MRRRAVIAVVAALASAACAGPRREHTIELQRKIAGRSWDSAIAQIETSKEAEYGRKNAVLYWLDKATVLHDAGRYQESDRLLDLAEQRMEDLYTRSVSKAVATVLVNEATEDYSGQVHERTLLYVLRALNYAYLRQPDEAAVEARKVTAFLAELNDRLGDRKLAYRDDAFAQYLSALLFEDQAKPDDARICFDAARTAYQAYASAFGVLPPPLPFGPAHASAALAPPPPVEAIPAAPSPSPPSPAPAPDLAEVPAPAAEAALAPAAADTSTAPPAAPPAAPPTAPPTATPTATPTAPPTAPPTATDLSVVPATLSTPGPTPVPPQGALPPDPAAGAATATGEIVLLHYNGPGPRRETATIQIAWNQAMIVFQASRESRENTQAKNALIAGIAGDAVTVAYPVFVQDPFVIHDSEVAVDGTRVRTVLVEDVTAIAKSTLAAALPAIQAKAIVRAVVKFLLARLAEQEARKRLGQGWGALAGIAARVGAAASEVADTRGWATLPSQFRLARIPASPGKHAVRVRYFGPDGSVVAEEVLDGVEVWPGRRTYLHVRTGM